MKNVYKFKLKSYEDKIKTNCHDDVRSKEVYYYICFSKILIDFVFKTLSTSDFERMYIHIVKRKKISSNESDGESIFLYLMFSVTIFPALKPPMISILQGWLGIQVHLDYD